MLKFKTLVFLLAVAGAAVAVGGCGGDDSPTDPAPNTLTLDAATAEDFTLEALGMVNDIVTMAPDFAAGSFTDFSAAGRPLAKVAGDSLEWDPDQRAWVFSYVGPLMEVEPPNRWNMSLDLWLQYRNAEETLQTPLGATEMQMRYGMGMDVYQVDEQTTLEMTSRMSTDVTVAYLGQDTYGIVGMGDAYVAVDQVSPQGRQTGNFTMDWTVDVTAAAGDCPSGTATVTSQGWLLAAEYNGQGIVAWTLTGPNWQSSGTDVVDCGQTTK